MKSFLRTTVNGNPILIATTAIVAMTQQDSTTTLLTLNAAVPGFDSTNCSIAVPLSFDAIVKELADEIEEFGDKPDLSYYPIYGGGPSDDRGY